MPAKPLLSLAAACALCSASLHAQQPAPLPLETMPYSPSLDVNSLDRSVDPCVNFYKFSCGGWQTHNPIPADQASWSVYAKLANDNQQFLWGILVDDAKAQNRTPVQQKVGDYFEACMNTDAIDALGDTPIEPELSNIDRLKTRTEIIAALPRLHHEYAGSFFFGSSTGQDAIDSSLMIVELGVGGLGLPDRDYYTKTDDKSVKIREQYAAYILKLLTLSGESPEQAKADAEATMKIEIALAKASLTRVERRDPHNTYHMESVRGRVEV
jgi:endothelin-converting enzyme/putative endopeptidase